MTYQSEAEAARRVWTLVRTLGVWPGYSYSRLAGGWVLTYDPPVISRGEHEGSLLI